MPREPERESNCDDAAAAQAVRQRVGDPPAAHRGGAGAAACALGAREVREGDEARAPEGRPRPVRGPLGAAHGAGEEEALGLAMGVGARKPHHSTAKNPGSLYILVILL